MLFLLDGANGSDLNWFKLIHAAIAFESLISHITNGTNGTAMIVQVLYEPKIEYTLPETNSLNLKTDWKTTLIIYFPFRKALPSGAIQGV